MCLEITFCLITSQVSEMWFVTEIWRWSLVEIQLLKCSCCYRHIVYFPLLGTSTAFAEKEGQRNDNQHQYKSLTAKQEVHECPLLQTCFPPHIQSCFLGVDHCTKTSGSVKQSFACKTLYAFKMLCSKAILGYIQGNDSRSKQNLQTKNPHLCSPFLKWAPFLHCLYSSFAGQPITMLYHRQESYTIQKLS